MSSLARGDGTLAVEVTNISGHGIWLYVRGTEHFLSYEDFPWFRDAAVKKILNVEEAARGHFFWPDLDIDPVARRRVRAVGS